VLVIASRRIHSLLVAEVIVLVIGGLNMGVKLQSILQEVVGYL
jgi:hypothetical protein